MSGAESTITFFPKYTTLVANTDLVTTSVDFSSLPLDVSRFGAAQMQVHRGALLNDIEPNSKYCEVFLEESLDAQEWMLGPSTPKPIPLYQDKVLYLSYSFRLRWFRMRVRITDARMTTLWAEGLLR